MVPVELYEGLDLLALLGGITTFLLAIGVFYKSNKDLKANNITNETNKANTLINTLEDRNELLSTKIDNLENRVIHLEESLRECRKVEVKYEKLKTKHYVGMMYLKATQEQIKSCKCGEDIIDIPYLLKSDYEKLNHGQDFDY